MPWGIAAAVAGPVISSVVSDSSGGGTSGGSAPQVYQPTQQPQVEQSWLNAYNNYGNATQGYYNQTQPLNQNLLGAQFNNAYNGDYLAGAGKAGQSFDTGAQNAQFAGNTLYNSGQYANYLGTQSQGRFANNFDNVQGAVNTQYGLANSSNNLFGNLIAQQQAQYGQINDASGRLYSGGNSILNTAFDPQQELYGRQSQLLTDQTRAGEYARGIQSSPLGASVEANALSNFNIDWQNQQLQRQQTGLSAAQGAYAGGQGLQNNYANNIAGLQTAGNNNYANLTNSAASQFSNFQSAQANNAATWAGTAANDFNAGNNLTQSAGNLYNASGASQYNAQNNIYGNQNAALTNFNNNTQPYLTSLGNIQTQGQNYLTGANQAQQQGWAQNNVNAQNQNAFISGLGNAASGAYKAYQGQQQSPYLNSNYNGGNDYGAYGTSSGYGSAVNGYNPLPTGSASGSYWGIE